MKKFFSITAICSLLLLANACNDDSKNPQYIFADMQMINHVCNTSSEADKAVCQYGEYELTINLDDYTASLNSFAILDEDGFSGSIDATGIPVTYNKTMGGYVIKAGTINNKGTLKGIFDLNLFLDYRSTENPTSRVSFSVGDYRVNATGNILKVSNPAVEVTSLVNGETRNENGASFIATINPDNNKATLVIKNLTIGNNTLNEITYANLDLNITKEGYKIVTDGDKKPSSLNGGNLGDLDKYVMKALDWKFNLDLETVTATFTIKDMADVTVNGYF
ncbi:MAG: hypothetical protein II034_02495 [Muribaculaceae bacterium]|nr:hypothetical protein [Muribaculaceae bacterium]